MPDIDWVPVIWVVCGLVALRAAHHAGILRGLVAEEYGPVWVAIATPMIFVMGWAMVAIFVAWAVCYGTYKLVTVPGPLELRARRRQRKAKERELERQQVMAEARRLGLPIVDDGEVLDA